MNARLEALADQNLPQAIRMHKRWQPAARLLELNGALLHQGTLPIPTPYQNCAMRLDAAVRPEQFMLQAQAFFGGSANPFAVITQSRHDLDLDAHLANEGFIEQANLPTMLVESGVRMPDIDPALRVDLLIQVSEIPAFVQVCAQAYESLGLPAMFTPSFFVDALAMMTADVSIALARNEQNQPLACAMALHTGEVAGVYWVGAVPQARGRGLAAACTAAVTNLALEKGAKAVTLQATHLGEPTYKRLGFREFGRMSRWSR
jgi:GNAT superfamily N-acetyltransferase